MMHQSRGSASSSIILAIVTIAVIGMGWWFQSSISSRKPSSNHQQSGRDASPVDSDQRSTPLTSATLFPVVISKPLTAPRVDTGLKDPHGNSVTVACATCHSTRPANLNNKLPADLNEFHGGMSMAHGMVSCLSCHNSADYDSLKMADGTKLEFSDVMTLCSQCHGTQRRDYDHGAHGGMNGYWDLTRGPRTRNNCVDCHDPHLPKLPHMQPTFKPHDRFLGPSHPATSKGGGHE